MDPLPPPKFGHHLWMLPNLLFHPPIAEDDFRSLDCQQKYAQAQIERLKKTNAFNSTFHIWHTGHFATINGFRLGN